MDQSNRPKTWDATRRGKPPAYIYNTIKEIQDETDHGQYGGKKTFNLFGVVKDFRSPAKSRGSDYFCIFRIIDESYCGDGIKVTLFADEDKLPRVNELNVIRLHRVKPSHNDGEMTLMSAWGWSIVQWDTQDKEEVSNGKSLSKTHTVDQCHKDRVKQLKDWIKSLFCNDSNSSLLCESEYKLENVTGEYYFFMTCQIAGIVKLKDDLTILRVWDGTTPALKIPFISDIEKDGMMKMDGMSLVENLMVDVCVYDGHSHYITENNITLGSYISLNNLHCSRKKDDKEGFELILHGGAHFDRGIKLLDDADPNLDEMKKKTADLLMQAKTNQNHLDNTNIQSTSSPRKESPSSDSESSFKTPPQTMMTSLVEDQSPSRKYLVDTSPLPLNFTVEKVNLLHEESNTVAMLELMDSEKLSQDEFLQETSLNDEDVDVVGSQSKEEVLRCQLESSTVVFGDSPYQITSLDKIISTFIPTSKSKLFRVRVNIDKFSNPNDSVIYFCPPTNLRIPAKNTGENIELAKDVADFLHLWRRFRGLDDENSECDVINDDEKVNQEHTQWMLPNNEIEITEYKSPKDDSLWQKLEVDKEYVIHKIKQGSQRFIILYTMNINGKEDFKKHAQKYDRVVHILSREILTSNSLPPVCYQDGVFYYCSPACVGQVRIPTLAHEAETFLFRQPLQALTIPLLLIKFTFRINISDQSGALNDLLLQGKNAVDFFNDTTPSQYLLNYEDCANDVQKDICNLTNAENMSNLELIIEKRARQSLEDGKDDVMFYDIINTRLKRN